MLTFEYLAKDKDGNEIHADLQADSERSAAKVLNDQGLTPLEIKVKGTGRGIFKKKPKVKTKDKVLFSRQLATLINAGLPLTQSLRTVLEQTQSKDMQVILNKVIADVESGSSFAKTLAKYPDTFNNVFVNLIAAGESSGTLDEALTRLADQQEKDAEVISKVRGALIYPALVLLVIVGVVIFMLTTVLPQVEQLYVDLKQELPFITSSMLVVSRFMISFWWAILLVLGASLFFLGQYSKTTNGKAFFDRLKIRTPLLKNLMMKLYMARFSRTGQTLLAAGVPMLEMLRITGRAVNNVHIERSLIRASEKVKGGKALSQSIEGDENFLALVPQMINIGEQSGSIDDMMGKAAQFYENELDNQIKTISTTIEPVLMVVLAVVAGLMVAAILLPVYGLVGDSISL